MINLNKYKNLEGSERHYMYFNIISEISEIAHERGINKVSNLNVDFNLSKDEILYSKYFHSLHWDDIEIQHFIEFKDVNSQDNIFKLTPLQLLVIASEDPLLYYDSDCDYVKAMLNEKSNLNLQNIFGDTILHIIAIYTTQTYDDVLSFNNDIHYILNNFNENLDLNLQNDNGDTILHLVSNNYLLYNDHLLVKKLIELGADINILNNKGEKPKLLKPVNYYLSLKE